MKAANKKAVGIKIKRNADVEPAQIDAIIKSDPQVIVVTTLYRRAGKDVTREGLYRALNGVGRYDAGGYTVSFGPEGRHGSHYVELAVISKNGQFRF
jgi:ABC-type branched-subunit amino acid transport system substrate-binding protein